MKLLFVTPTDVNITTSGGNQGTNRNYLSFCELLGFGNVEVINTATPKQITFSNRIRKWLNYLRGYPGGLSSKTIKKIINHSEKTDYVFIDDSDSGIIAYYLKKHRYKGQIICYFHNVEFNIRLEILKSNPLTLLRFLIVFYNEKKAIRYSDKIIAITKRDYNELCRIYTRFDKNKIYIIPVSLSDKFTKPVVVSTSNPPTFLFIGFYWYANIHGIKWFVDNVLDHVNIKLQIVGKGMDILKNEFIDPKIEFLGFVQDLSEVIENADYMISPIFKGGGMKVKTCEALMYGKNIIGTNEAFEGYELDYSKVGAICETKDEFIETINKYCSIKRPKFNTYSRQFFLEKYSFHATLEKFARVLSN